MPYTKLEFKPGFNKEGTNYANEGAWFDGDQIRFRMGYPETIGGYKNINYTTSFDGVCRKMFNFSLLSQADVMFLGTNEKVYLEESNTYRDITPLRRTRLLPFQVTAPLALQGFVGDLFVGINTLPAVVKGVSATIELSKLLSISTERKGNLGSFAATAVGTVTIINSPINAVVAGSSIDMSVTTYVDQINMSLGEITTVTSQPTVDGPIIS